LLITFFIPQNKLWVNPIINRILFEDFQGFKRGPTISRKYVIMTMFSAAFL